MNKSLHAVAVGCKTVTDCRKRKGGPECRPSFHVLWSAMQREAGKKTGGLGSSHTTPCGAAVPARPPTRSSETTQLSCEPQWVRRATEQSTGVVVQGGHAEPKTKLPPLSKQLIISKMGGQTQRLLWSALPIVLTQFW